jgi:hypothetical protein
MKNMILTAVAALALTSGVALAQGTAGAREPVYGSAWAANQRAEALAAAHRATTAQAPADASERSASASSAVHTD